MGSQLWEHTESKFYNTSLVDTPELRADVSYFSYMGKSMATLSIYSVSGLRLGRYNLRAPFIQSIDRLLETAKGREIAKKHWIII